jgi:hypothetical protein
MYKIKMTQIDKLAWIEIQEKILYRSFSKEYYIQWW